MGEIKLPPLPNFGWSCMCTKCRNTWVIDKPQKSADCKCGYAAFVIQNTQPTVEQMQEYARQAVREAVTEFKQALAVAVCQLYDTDPSDVVEKFTLEELNEFVAITEPLRPQQVEDIYRKAWDMIAAAKEAK